MKQKITKLPNGGIAVDLACEFCGLPITKTSVKFGMDCANHCSETKHKKMFGNRDMKTELMDFLKNLDK